MKPLGWALIQSDECPNLKKKRPLEYTERDERDIYACRKGQVRKKSERWPCEAKERHLRRKQIEFDLRLLESRSERKQYFVV